MWKMGALVGGLALEDWWLDFNKTKKNRELRHSVFSFFLGSVNVWS
jgi:hypothetical protein